jgi:hypothetical protein
MRSHLLGILHRFRTTKFEMVFFEIILQLQIAVLIHGCHIFVPLNRIDVLIALLGNAAQHFLISKLEGRFFQI